MGTLSIGSGPLIWAISALATAGVILRPWRLPEAIWAVAGAVLLVLAGLVPWREALGAVGKGMDVYLFLAGMMLLAELARREGLFDWLAALATELARGSARRLLGLIYLVGILVTVFLSNDATAVVLTPAVYAATRAARAPPLPHLFACAFVANAASFVLPISNPANLVVFGGRMPPLLDWLARFALPSFLAIVLTYAMLRLVERRDLGAAIARHVVRPALPATGVLAAAGIGVTALLLLTASSLRLDLGLPTFLAGVVTAAIVLARKRENPLCLVRGIAWSVLPLVAGLFVLVDGLMQSGMAEWLGGLIRQAAASPPAAAIGAAGFLTALASNLMNNLPIGLIAGSLDPGALPPSIGSALLIGVDLGPNLSVTGSLATILWLAALRREGIEVGPWRFLLLGLAIMPPALAAALAGVVLTSS